MNEFLKHRKILTISTLALVVLVVAAVVLSINLTSSSDNNSKTIKGMEQRLDAAVKSGKITQEKAHARQRQATSGKSQNGANRKPGITLERITAQLNAAEERLNAAVKNGELTQEEASAKQEQLNTKRVALTEKRAEIDQKLDQRLTTSVENGTLTQEEADAKREQRANNKLPSERKQNQIAKKSNPGNCCHKKGSTNPHVRSDDSEQKTDKRTKGRKHNNRNRGPQNHNAERQRR
ncbi:MAG: hypothetical protein ACJ0J7_04100 [Tepidiformaceae bacterium]|tara:strand:- start:1155 stop:1862 length:708 start_codon:yes stop_codon:yes gene_type:complete